MKSLRLDADLEARVAQAAAVRGETVSQFLREAAAERADVTLGAKLDSFDDVLGVVRGGGNSGSRRTGKAFADLLVERSSGT